MYLVYRHTDSGFHLRVLLGAFSVHVLLYFNLVVSQGPCFSFPPPPYRIQEMKILKKKLMTKIRDRKMTCLLEERLVGWFSLTG